MQDAQILSLSTVILFLGSGVVGIALCHYLRLSPIIGYLLAGVAIGPFGYGLSREHSTIHLLAELGLVFLLFDIGLHFAFRRLWRLRKDFFVLGTLQVLVTGSILGLFAWALGETPQTSVLIGALALSSTAIALQLLNERRESTTPLGQTATSILIFQDLAIVFLLILVPAMAGGEQSMPLSIAIGLSVVKAAVAMAAVYLFGKWLLKPLLRWILSLGEETLFTATILLIIFTTGALTGMSGLSIPLGAFLAGLIISETQYCQMVKAEIHPFRLLLLGLFFITVGMEMNLDLILERWDWIIAVTLGMVTIKALSLWALSRAVGKANCVSLRLGFLLAQGGEFLFVLFALGEQAGLMSQQLTQSLAAVVGLSFLLSPALAKLGERLARRPSDSSQGLEDVSANSRILIVGYGQEGRTVARFLGYFGIEYLIIEPDHDRVATAALQGFRAVVAKPTAAVLSGLETQNAAAVVLTLDSDDNLVPLIQLITSRFQGVPVFADVRDPDRYDAIIKAGATEAFCERSQIGYAIARHVTTFAGIPDEKVRGLGSMLLQELHEEMDAPFVQKSA